MRGPVMPGFTPDRYYTHLAACFCRGRLTLSPGTPDSEALALGEQAGLRLVTSEAHEVNLHEGS